MISLVAEDGLQRTVKNKEGLQQTGCRECFYPFAWHCKLEPKYFLLTVHVVKHCNFYVLIRISHNSIGSLCLMVEPYSSCTPCVWSEVTPVCCSEFLSDSSMLKPCSAYHRHPVISIVSSNAANLCMQSPYTMEGTFAAPCLPTHSNQHASQLL